VAYSLHEIPELVALRHPDSVVRIAPGVDVPVTPRVRSVIDTATFRRLQSISQLGLVSLVYPGATHTRFEHSLGVYRMALLYLQRLAGDRRFAELVDAPLAERFLLAALLHDVGHYPYCHPIEDMQLAGHVQHETLARAALNTGELAQVIHTLWATSGDVVADLLEKRYATQAEQLVGSLLSSPIDIDKVDYLQRDSHHAGVPYGNHFDQGRLIGSLCVNEQGNGLALTDKGKTAAELLVFARYIMFSEVYWHHAVRSATAMLQRQVWHYARQGPLSNLMLATDLDFGRQLLAGNTEPALADLHQAIWGDKRSLYKRLAQYSLLESPDVYRQVARRPYAWLVECSRRLAHLLGARETEVLIDAPPVGLEVQFNVDLWFAKQQMYRPLGEVSPVVRALAREQFDDYVKRVRVFVSPTVRERIALSPGEVDSLVCEAADFG
jgi:HD superfamily phosphohydrolase